MNRSKKVTVLSAMIGALVMLSGPVQADPERSYQGGKAASGVYDGKNKVDDRGFEERVGDYLKDKGAGKKDSNAGKYDPNYSKPSAPKPKK